MDLGIAGKKALVLGASRGLGAAIAAALADEKVQVTGASRNPDAIRRWIDEGPAERRAHIDIATVDLADTASVDALADSLLADGGVDILINNSGGPGAATALAATHSDWTTEFEAMAANLFHLTQRLVPAMIGHGWGRIITIGSSGVIQPIPSLAISNAVRAAVSGWSKTLATEVAAHGITVNMVIPGRIGTERVRQLDQLAAQRGNISIEETRQRSITTIPVQRYGTPEEFAAVVAFLASTRASYMTGSSVRVDGGMIRSV